MTEERLGWRVWYNSLVYDSNTSSRTELPVIGVIYVVEYFTKRKVIHTGQVNPDASNRYYIIKKDNSVHDFEGTYDQVKQAFT